MTDLISEYLELFLAFSAVIGVLYGLIRRGQKALEHKILSEMQEYTKQIQPLANGGLSLSDANNRLERLEQKVDLLVENQSQIKCDVELLKESVVTLENDAEGIE